MEIFLGLVVPGTETGIFFLLYQNQTLERAVLQIAFFWLAHCIISVRFGKKFRFVQPQVDALE